MVDAERRHERGVALLLAVLMLAIMGAVGLASMDTTMRDRQIAGFQKRAQTAFYAAEAGVSLALALLRADAQALAEGGEGALADYDPSGETPPRFPNEGAPTFLGTDFPLPGSPSFYLDPEASDPSDPGAPPKAIRYVGRGDTCPGWIMTANVGGGNVQWAEALWDIRVRGTNPGGTDTSIQVTGTNCHPYN